MSDALKRGLDFLIQRQHAAGYWQDWQLPVGSSSMWTTAYVGWRLSSCAGKGAEFLHRAADWLETNELEGGGWGYAKHTGADADSTALGILFLSALRRSPPESALARLLDYRRADGGFATYGMDQSFGGWTASQVEITAAAALALSAAAVGGDAVEQAKQFVEGKRRQDGLWDSYWWTSPCYATQVAVRLLGEQASRNAAASLCSLRPGNAFEAALQCLAGCDRAQDLIAAQEPDGSWPSAPVLRLTRRDWHAPQESEDAGPSFADEQRIFTTATVVSALAELQSARRSAPFDGIHVGDRL